MRTNFRNTIAKDMRACANELLASGRKVLNFKTNMVDGTGGMMSQKIGDRGIVTERLDQFDSGIRKLDEYHSHAVVWQGGGVAHLCSKRAAIKSARSLNILDCDSDVIQ